MSYKKNESIFANPQNFVLRLYNTETENQRSVSFDLFESFLTFKKTGVLVIQEKNVDEFMKDNKNDDDMLAMTNVEYPDGNILKLNGGELSQDELDTLNSITVTKVRLEDQQNSNIYELSIQDGVLEVNNITNT